MAGKSKLEGDSKCLDRHDGNGADSRADREVNESVLLAMDGGNFVYHENGEGYDGDRVEEEALNFGLERGLCVR